MEERVVLVDLNDHPVGEMEKMEAHVKGRLHRAFSVFVFNRKGELLLQRRAVNKYHSAGLWTNTCCSHPRPGEDVSRAADRRLWEEMGLVCDLNRRFSFVYRSELEKGLVEHEYDHVFVGWTDTAPRPNPEEVDGCRYLSVDAIRGELEVDAASYTIWFRTCFEQAARFALDWPLSLNGDSH